MSDILKVLSKTDSDLIFLEGFESALVGVCSRIGQPDVAIYDYGRCIEILMERDDVDESEAEDHMQYNVLGAYLGVRTPAFLHRPE